MSFHRFKIDEKVIASAEGIPPGPYRITRLLPASDNGILNYRGRHLETDQERALTERALQPWSEHLSPFAARATPS
jgi:hypothetical protein